MKKRIALALVMILTLSLLTACGGGSTQNPQPTTAQKPETKPAPEQKPEEVKISVKGAEFPAGGAVEVTVTGVTEKMVADKCWISIYLVGASERNWHDIVHIEKTGTVTLTLEAPEKSGTYEVRLIPQENVTVGVGPSSESFTVTSAEDSLTLVALIAAGERTDYEVDEDWSRPIGVLGDTRPFDGFFMYYVSDSASLQFEFMEFESAEDALSYKEANDEDSSAMFPDYHIPCGRFLGVMSKGFGDELDEAVESLISDIFADALANPVADDGSRRRDSDSIERKKVGKTQEEVEAMLSNYSITLTADMPGQLSVPYVITQAVDDKGMFFEMTGEYNRLRYIDFTTNTDYDLDAETMTGDWEKLDDSTAARFKGFHFLIAQYLFRHTMYDLEEIGKYKVLGRDTTVYAEDIYEGQIRFWIDDEYGFTLKCAHKNFTIDVTEFIIGGVVTADMIDLDEFELEEYVDVAPPGPDRTIVEGVLSIGAMDKAAEDAGFTVWDGWFILSNWESKLTSDDDPVDGIQISVRKNNSNYMCMTILEWENEEIAKEYEAWAADPGSYSSGNMHRSGVFTLYLESDVVAENEANLLEALKKAGWK